MKDIPIIEGPIAANSAGNTTSGAVSHATQDTVENFEFDLRCDYTKRSDLIYGRPEKEGKDTCKLLRVSPIRSIRNQVNEDGVKVKILQHKAFKERAKHERQHRADSASRNNSSS